MSERQTSQARQNKKTHIKKKLQQLLLSDDYYSDIDIDEMLYGVLLRSSSDHGVITSISYPNLPDGYRFFTAADIPGNNTITALDTNIPILCSGTVAYKGEPLGILVGPDSNEIKNLLTQFEVFYDTKAPSRDPTTNDRIDISSTTTGSDSDYKPASEEIAAVSPQLNVAALPVLSDAAEKTNSAEASKKKDKSVAAFRSIKTGFANDPNPLAFEKLFTEADRRVKHTWTYYLRHQSYTEPDGAICLMTSDILNVFTPTQWLSHLRKTLSSVLKLKKDHIIVKKTKVASQNTNSIWGNAIIASQAGVAALLTSKPVKLELSRNEQKSYMENPAPITITIDTAVTATGIITALRMSIDIDIGAYNPFAQEILDRLVIASCGFYKIPNLKITGQARYSNNPPASVDIKYIEAQACYAIENQIELIAAVANLSPVDIRKLNSYTNSGNTDLSLIKFQPVKINETIDGLMSISDFRRKYTTYHLNNLEEIKSKANYTYRAPIRGIGFACALNGSGYFNSKIYDTDQIMEVTMEKDGTLTIHSLLPSHSILQIWQTTASQILGINPEAVKLNSIFDSSQEPQLPENVYSNLSIMTQLLKKCCQSIQKKRFRLPLPITEKKRVTPAQKKKWNSTTFSGLPFHSTSCAAAAVELEFDPTSFSSRLKGIWITVDCGEILSIMNAKHTIRRNIQQVLSELVEDTNLTCDNIHISFLQSTGEPRQLDGLVYNVIPAAFSSALSQACMFTVSSLPIKTDTLYNLALYTQTNQREIKTVGSDI